MRFSYRLDKVCGEVYSHGNILFTADGNSVLSVVGNRVSIVDLVHHSTKTLPFENKKNIHRIAISHDGIFLVTVDVDGHSLFINLPRQVVLQRFHFKRSVYDIKFSPDDSYFAVTFAKGCQIWKTPSIQKEFSPLSLSRNIAGFLDDATCLDWSEDSQSIIIGAKDLTAKVFYRVHSKHMAMTTLSGHRDIVMGCYFTKDALSAYSIARDGAIFTWNFVGNQNSDSAASAAGGGNGNSSKSEEDNEEDSNYSNDDDSDDDDEDDVNKGSSGGGAGVVLDSNKQRKRALKEQNNSNKQRKHGNGSNRRKSSSSKGRWELANKEFLWDHHSEVTSVAYNKATKLLVVGFNKGVFGLYEMPGCVNIHKLSVSQSMISAATINPSGEWLALGSSALGQLLVWEWQSESYVLKQQGHLYGLNCVDFSSDGIYIASGGEDGKVKLWNASSGFCFVTFTEHIAPITGVKFIGQGNGRAVLSASLDGTVRAHDLLRYRNFKTLTTPEPVQFNCLAADSSGEIICAGSLDPFNIYVWSLQTGQLLDILAGHEGPIACMDFSPVGNILASGSWDGTIKLWDVVKNENMETFEHGCDILGICFRPDGKEVSCCAVNGNIYFWDVESGERTGTIEGRRDISGGRLTSEARTADTSSRNKCFTSLCYSADGEFVLAAGRSKYACIYSIASGGLVKKFQLSHNKSLEGVLDQLRSDGITDGIVVGNVEVDKKFGNQSDARGAVPNSSLTDGSRLVRPEILTKAIKFSTTGREWAAATTQGLQIFSLDSAMTFAPTDIDISITPQAIAKTVSKLEFGLAVNMALHLGENDVLKKTVDAVPTSAIELVVKSLDPNMLRGIFRFLAEELAASRHVEYYLHWAWNILCCFGNTVLNKDSMVYMESYRALIRAISIHEKEIVKMCNDNQFFLKFLSSQIESASSSSSNSSSGGGATSKAGGSDEVD